MKIKTYYFNNRKLDIPEQAIEDCSCSGSNDNALAQWVSHVNFGELSDNDIVSELEDCGAWSTEELQDRALNETRLLWIACHSIKELEYEDERERKITNED